MINKNTTHQIIIGAAQKMEQLSDNSIELVVTSPPYPMIEMWDEIMSNQNPEIKTALSSGDGPMAFELMHCELDKIWAEVDRVLIPGGFACINIGDSTRTINGEFALYPSHSRIISAFQKLGLANLPNILWRKQTNAPNKFMGSGMLPSGAYVTLEHEWILIFRKGGKTTI
jgi:DNA modification methylase